MKNKIIKKLRMKNNISQRELGEKIGVSRTSVSAYERCKQKPSFKIAKKIVKYFNINIKQLNYYHYSTKKKTNEKFKNDVKKEVGDEYEFLEKYINAKTKIKLIHNKCGYIYKAVPDNFLSGNGRCPKCNKYYQKNNYIFKEEVKKIVGEEYKILGEYINDKIKIKIKHNECGNVYKVAPSKFLSGRRCPKCQHESVKKTTKKFKKETRELVGKEYSVLGEYINNYTKIKIKHNKCGNIFEINPNHFLYKNGRCRKCFNKSSYVEEKIKKYLEYNNIKYKKEYVVNGCSNFKTNYNLRFDFALFKNNNLFCLIEYDGIFHYKPVEGLTTITDVKNQQFRDEIKNVFCDSCNISLIRINYKQKEKIYSILDKEIGRLNKLRNKLREWY